MEYQKKYKVIAPPCRFHWTDEHIKLERKFKERHAKGRSNMLGGPS